jgi:streptogramin lyase
MEWRLQEGFYPQGIRFDAQDRAWFALGLSSKVGVFDRTARTFRYIDLPARGVLDQLLMWYTQWSLEGGRGGEPPRYDLETSGIPFPYDLDVAPDADDIARIDPSSFAVEMIRTPFAGPRRIRIDAAGNPWITAFAEGALARYRTRDKTFDLYPLPVAGETPYGLGIDARRGLVWVNGSQSDALFSFSPATGAWQRYPLPRRGTYTRDIGIDENGTVYTTNANFPARHIEGGQPTLIRLVPLSAR